MNTLTIKNFLKKQTLFAALMALCLWGTATAMKIDIASINEDTIATILPEDIKTLLYTHKTNYNIMLEEGNNQTINFTKNKEIKRVAQKLAHCITPNNIGMISPSTIKTLISEEVDCISIIASSINKDNIKNCYWIIYHILNVNKSCAPTFASYITEDNIKDNQHAVKHILKADTSIAPRFASFITQYNIKDCYTAIDSVLKTDKSYASKFASYITKNNIKDCYGAAYHILLADESYASIFASYITEDTIKDNLITVANILQTDKSCAKKLASYITKENIKDNQYTISCILQADKSCAKTFASYITQENFKDCDFEIIYCILKADKSYVLKFASCITHDNYLLVSETIYELLVNHGLDLTKKLNKLGFSPKKNSTITIDPLTTYLCAGNKFNTFIYLTQKSNIATKLEPIEKNLENQHFAIRFEKILNFFGSKLDSIDVRYSLNDIKKQSILGLKKGRNYICHGRNSEAFVCNNVFKKILEIYYGQPIKKNWYIMHHKFPDQYPTYDRALEIKKLGNSQASNHTEERNHMQFASDLFGTSPGGSALEFTLKNANVSIGSSLMPIEKMFERLAVELGLEKDALQKYYLRYKECFDMLELLGKQFKHGTLLMYLLDKEILANFTYVTHDAYGMKESPIAIEGIGKTFESNDVLDTLLHNPEKFIDKDGTWEYVFVMSQDHPTDKNKLGSANPFNPGIDIYSFNFGEDKKIAQIIQKGIDILFYNRIIPDMIKDGVIKDTGAFKKETINFEEQMITSKL